MAWIDITGKTSPPCHHLWFGVKREVDPDKNLSRITQQCPKCGRVKVTVRMLDSRVMGKRKLRSARRTSKLCKEVLARAAAAV